MSILRLGGAPCGMGDHANPSRGVVVIPLACIRTTVRYDTYMSKLTLSVDDQVVRRAKGFAERRGTSVSELVERFLDLLTRPPRDADVPPVLKMLRGAAKGVSGEDHHRHLLRKYR